MFPIDMIDALCDLVHNYSKHIVIVSLFLSSFKIDRKFQSFNFRANFYKQKNYHNY